MPHVELNFMGYLICPQEFNFMGQETNIILAPHADDAIIGCWSIIKKPFVYVLYNDEDTLIEAAQFIAQFNLKAGLILDLISLIRKRENAIIYAPNPFTELHPLHKEIGMRAYRLAQSGLKVVFYSTNMNTNSLVELEDYKSKKKALEMFYPDKADLWKYDWKYFLFESHEILFADNFLK